MLMKEQDISFRSVSLIEKLVCELFKNNVHIPDWGMCKNDDIVPECAIVLTTGLFYQKVFEIKDWPQNDFSFFCLSSAVKKVLVELLGFDSEVIGVIPRYRLFPPAQNFITYPGDFNFKLVHAGRISPQKNIEFIIFVTFYFQILLSPSIELTLMGNFDNDHHRNTLGIKNIDYKNKIIRLIDSLPWPGKKPEILSDFNPTEWLTAFPSNGIFFSASNLISEDFSVSIAQIQQSLGSPCLIPYWGGFKDVRGDNIRFYDVNNIATSNEPFEVLSKKAKLFVESYAQKKLFHTPLHLSNTSNFISPQKINRGYLIEKIVENKKRWGDEIKHIENGDFYLFAKSQNGQKFFKEYIKIFG